jgi:hypothetical protein
MMKITTRSIRISGLFLLAASQAFAVQYALAGTIVKVQSKNELTTMIIDGKKARMDMSASEYVVIDYKNRKVSMVSPQEKQVMEMSMDALAGNSSSSGVPKVRDSLSRRGAGPAIAGYATQKYSYSVNGKSCGDIYASIDAYNAKGMKELLKAMRTMVDQQRSMLGGLAGMMDDCTLADMQMVDRVENIGIPMRTVKNGRVESEVVSIQTDVSISADSFAIPASYKKVSLEQQMEQARQAMPPAMQQAPQQMPPGTEDMMRQMQQSGQMTPEMMEQMRRAQEMMRQYQQPRN